MRMKAGISGTAVAYYHLCHRKLWFFGNGIRMENATDNAFVEEGKLIDEHSYARRPQKWRALDLGSLKIDHFDPTTHTVREVKKSSKLEAAHIAQVKYYLFALRKQGLMDATGIIEYPKEKRKTAVTLTDDEMPLMEAWEADIERIMRLEQCPELIKKRYCDSCAFKDFCFI